MYYPVCITQVKIKNTSLRIHVLFLELPVQEVKPEIENIKAYFLIVSSLV